MRKQGIGGWQQYGMKRDKLFVTLYRFCESCPITRGYVKKIRGMFLRHCPLEEHRLQKKTIQLCLAVWISAGLVTVLLFLRNPGIDTLALSVFYAVVVSKELVRIVEKNTERRVLKQLEKVLNDVRHFYYDTHSITAALTEVAGLNGYEMRLHIEELIAVLEAEKLMEAVEEYNRLSGNRFLKMFLSQCVAIQEYGDCERNGESVFVRNLNDLRADVLNYLLQVDRQQLEFGGLSFITLVPLLALPFIRSTAVATLPELERFYSGMLGVILPVLYLLVTIGIYAAIVEMQELDASVVVKHKVLYRIEQNRVVSRWLDLWERKNYGKVQKQKHRLRKAGESMTPRLWMLEKLIYLCVTLVLGAGVLVYAHGQERRQVLVQESLQDEVSGESQLSGQPAETASEKYEQRMLSCRIKWYEAMVLLFCGLSAYGIPDLRLWYKTTLMRMNMLSEVTQFQSIIMMQMFIPDITVLRILTSMEQFAFIFRTGIQECINEYSYSVTVALDNMKKSERYEPFRRLCDNLLMVDKIGIIRAFEEIAQDREHFQKQREEDTYRMIRKKSGQARLLAFVPMLTIICSYLILPYGVEALNQFTVIMQELNTM